MFQMLQAQLRPLSKKKKSQVQYGNKTIFLETTDTEIHTTLDEQKKIMVKKPNKIVHLQMCVADPEAAILSSSRVTVPPAQSVLERKAP